MKAILNMRNFVNNVDEIVIVIEIVLESLDDGFSWKVAEETWIHNIHQMFSVLNVTRHHIDLYGRDISGQNINEDVVLSLLCTSEV